MHMDHLSLPIPQLKEPEEKEIFPTVFQLSKDF